jgi:hypothetical protein
MQRPVAVRRTKPFPWGLAGALVLIAACEAYVARHTLDLTRQDNWEWRLSSRAASRKPARAGVLAFGSSLIKLGLVPQMLEASAGRAVYNLAVCGGSAPASYILLRRAIESGARPSAVIVEFHPLSMTSDAWHTAAFWPDLLDTGETIELAFSMRDARFFAAVTFARALSSLKDRHELRNAIVAALRGEQRPAGLSVLALMRNLNKNRGSMIVPPLAEAGDRALPAEDIAAASVAWSCNPFNERYVRKFLALARAHGITVVWLLPPVSPALQDLRDRSGRDAGYKAFVASCLAREPRLVVVDATGAGFGLRHFIDGQHLNRDGATLWTRAIETTLRDVVRGDPIEPRWVTASTSDYQHAPGALALEDYGESYRAVQTTAQLPRAEVRR